MAAFTSTISGNWNDGATWGLTSPGVKGTDWPGLAGDTATVAATHTVTYNVSETNQLGAVTVNGLLSFATNANTLLTLGHVDLTVGSTGELRIGTSGSPLLKTYTAEMVWATTADNAKGLVITNGGLVTLYGDPAYYGANGYKAQLSADWTAGQSFTVTGDYSGWNVGDVITVHKNALYSSTTTDTQIFTIASASYAAGVTTITINEAAPAVTFKQYGHVNDVSRNVKLSKSGATTTMGAYNTNRPIITDNTLSTNTNKVNILNCLVTGFYSYTYTGSGGFNANFMDCVWRHGAAFMYGGGYVTNLTWSGLFYSNGGVSGSGFSYYGVNCTISGDIYANGATYIFNLPTDFTCSADIYGNSGTVINTGSNCTFSGNFFSNGTVMTGAPATHNFYGSYIYGNTTAVNQASCNFNGCAIGYKTDGTTVLNNTTDVNMSAGANWYEAYFRGCKMPSSLTIGGRNTGGHVGFIGSQDHNRVAGDARSYQDFADLTRDTGTLRTGGADNSIKIAPLSNCTKWNPVFTYDIIELDVPASAQTRTVYVDTYGYSVLPDATELYLEAEYISNGATYARTLVKSTDVVSANGTWTALNVSFTPAAVGQVRLRIYLKKYQASSGVYVDNRIYGTKTIYTHWRDGKIQIDQSVAGGAGGVSRGRLLNSGGF
ncbi:MAG: hypothetical protein HZB84_10595 [Deltaproteobacteria bacterium]|nr:hypothetical protein [Deltaproteobacteria bacterium]